MSLQNVFKDRKLTFPEYNDESEIYGQVQWLSMYFTQKEKQTATAPFLEKPIHNPRAGADMGRGPIEPDAIDHSGFGNFLEVFTWALIFLLFFGSAGIFFDFSFLCPFFLLFLFLLF
jgi:hypothetical protein